LKGDFEVSAYLLGALAFVVAVAVFVFQNNTDVTVHFINWTSPKVSLALVVLISACAGALITFLVDSYRAFKTGQTVKQLTKENRKYEKELKALKGEKAGTTKGKAASPKPAGEELPPNPPEQ